MAPASIPCQARPSPRASEMLWDSYLGNQCRPAVPGTRGGFRGHVSPGVWAGAVGGLQ